MPFIHTLGQSQSQIVFSTTKPSKTDTNHPPCGSVYCPDTTDEATPRFQLDVSPDASKAPEKAREKRKQEQKKYAAEQAQNAQIQAEVAARHTVDAKTVTALRTLVQSALDKATPHESGDALAEALKLTSALLSASQGSYLNGALPQEAVHSRQELSRLQGQISSTLHHAGDKALPVELESRLPETRRELLA